MNHLQCGTLHKYNRGCRCDLCRAANVYRGKQERELRGPKEAPNSIRILLGSQVRELLACPNRGCRIDHNHNMFRLCDHHVKAWKS